LDDVKRLLQIGKCQFFLFLSVKNQTADLLFGDSDLLADGKCTIKMTVIYKFVLNLLHGFVLFFKSMHNRSANCREKVKNIESSSLHMG